MRKILISIESLPYTVKQKVQLYLNKKILLVGYKRVSKKYKTPVLELSNKKRIWVLQDEIRLKKVV